MDGELTPFSHYHARHPDLKVLVTFHEILIVFLVVILILAYDLPHTIGLYNPLLLNKEADFLNTTLQGINISHLGKRKIIDSKCKFLGDMLVPWRVVNFFNKCFGFHQTIFSPLDLWKIQIPDHDLGASRPRPAILGNGIPEWVYACIYIYCKNESK